MSGTNCTRNICGIVYPGLHSSELRTLAIDYFFRTRACFFPLDVVKDQSDDVISGLDSQLSASPSPPSTANGVATRAATDRRALCSSSKQAVKGRA